MVIEVPLAVILNGLYHNEFLANILYTKLVSVDR